MAGPRYRVGVIGSTGRGDYGHGLDSCWAAVENTEVVAVADDNRAGLASAANRIKAPKSFLDYRKMLNEVRPDIASICPRWVDQRREMILAAVELGIHVYTEKPFCRNLREADEIATAARKSGAKIAVAHPTRYSPRWPVVLEFVRSGGIGRVLEYRARGKEDQRGGAEDLWVLGSHMLDLIVGFEGGASWCYAQVTRGGKAITGADVAQGAEGIGPLAGDGVEARYGYDNGAIAYLSSRKGAAGKPSRYGLQIFGTGGIVEILEAPMPSVKCLVGSGWNLGRNAPAWQEISSAGLGKPEPLSGDPVAQSRHTRAIRDFLDAIEKDREPLCGQTSARRVLEMILGVFESQRVGAPVRFPLAVDQHPLERLQAAAAAR